MPAPLHGGGIALLWNEDRAGMMVGIKSATFHAYMKNEISIKGGNESSKSVLYYSSKSIEAVSPISSKEVVKMIADRARAMMAAGKVIPELEVQGSGFMI